MVEVNEEMEGWESFTETLPENLPGCNRWSESFFQIAFPAFATNETQIFERTAFQCQEKQQQRNESPPP